MATHTTHQVLYALCARSGGVELPPCALQDSVERQWAEHAALKGVTGSEAQVALALPLALTLNLNQVRLTEYGPVVRAAAGPGMLGHALLEPPRPSYPARWAAGGDALLQQHGKP